MWKFPREDALPLLKEEATEQSETSAAQNSANESKSRGVSDKLDRKVFLCKILLTRMLARQTDRKDRNNFIVKNGTAAGTIIHECTHLALGTVDFGYGPATCEVLSSHVGEHCVMVLCRSPMLLLEVLRASVDLGSNSGLEFFLREPTVWEYDLALQQAMVTFGADHDSESTPKVVRSTKDADRKLVAIVIRGSATNVNYNSLMRPEVAKRVRSVLQKMNEQRTAPLALKNEERSSSNEPGPGPVKVPHIAMEPGSLVSVFGAGAVVPSPSQPVCLRNIFGTRIDLPLKSWRVNKRLRKQLAEMADRLQLRYHENFTMFLRGSQGDECYYAGQHNGKWKWATSPESEWLELFEDSTATPEKLECISRLIESPPVIDVKDKDRAIRVKGYKVSELKKLLQLPANPEVSRPETVQHNNKNWTKIYNTQFK